MQSNCDSFDLFDLKVPMSIAPFEWHIFNRAMLRHGPAFMQDIRRFLDKELVIIILHHFTAYSRSGLECTIEMRIKFRKTELLQVIISIGLNFDTKFIFFDRTKSLTGPVWPHTWIPCRYCYYQKLWVPCNKLDNDKYFQIMQTFWTAGAAEIKST